jgi:hypothetical protein
VPTSLVLFTQVGNGSDDRSDTETDLFDLYDIVDWIREGRAGTRNRNETDPWFQQIMAPTLEDDMTRFLFKSTGERCTLAPTVYVGAQSGHLHPIPPSSLTLPLNKT